MSALLLALLLSAPDAVTLAAVRDCINAPDWRGVRLADIVDDCTTAGTLEARRGECLDEFELDNRADSLAAGEQCKRVGR